MNVPISGGLIPVSSFNYEIYAMLLLRRNYALNPEDSKGNMLVCHGFIQGSKPSENIFLLPLLYVWKSCKAVGPRIVSDRGESIILTLTE